MYQAYLLLQPKTDFTLAEAGKRLTAAFPGYALAEGPGSLGFTSDDWEFHLQMNEGPDVLEDSRQIAEQIGGVDDERGIATCSRRVEVGSDIPDPHMEHFDKYLRVMETLQSFQGVIGIDPQEPSLL